MCYTDTISAVVIMLAAICNAKSCKPVFVVSASECLGVQDSRRKKRVRERERDSASQSDLSGTITTINSTVAPRYVQGVRSNIPTTIEITSEHPCREIK